MAVLSHSANPQRTASSFHPLEGTLKRSFSFRFGENIPTSHTRNPLIFFGTDDPALDGQISSFLGAVLDGEMKAFGTKTRPSLVETTNKG
jgi:hypothetical protein